jgi:hypothetical protein
MKKLLIISALSLLILLLFVLNCKNGWFWSWYLGRNIESEINTINLQIKGVNYYLKGTVGGIGGHELVTISCKDKNILKYDKNEDIYYSSSNLSSVYYDTINDTIVLYIDSLSQDDFIIPTSANRIPFKYERINTINKYRNAKALIDYYSIERE